MNLDAKNLRAGRLATVAAKRALLGEEVNICNASDAVITGEKKRILQQYKQQQERGTPTTGPFQHRIPARMLKRIIRGMLPHKQPRGREALKRIKCYNTVPEELKDAKLETVEAAHIDNSMATKYITLREIASFLGGKHE